MKKTIVVTLIVLNTLCLAVNAVKYLVELCELFFSYRGIRGVKCISYYRWIMIYGSKELRLLTWLIELGLFVAVIWLLVALVVKIVKKRKMRRQTVN